MNRSIEVLRKTIQQLRAKVRAKVSKERYNKLRLENKQLKEDLRLAVREIKILLEQRNSF